MKIKQLKVIAVGVLSVMLLAGCTSNNAARSNDSASATAAGKSESKSNAKTAHSIIHWGTKEQAKFTDYMSSYAQVNGADLITATDKQPATFANRKWPAVYSQLEAKLSGKLVYLRSGKVDINSDIYVVRATYALQVQGKELPSVIYISAMRRGAPVLFTVEVNTQASEPYLQLTTGGTNQVMQAFSTIEYGSTPGRAQRE